MARHLGLGATAIFKEPILPSPSLAADDFVEFEDLEAQPRSSEDVPIPNLRIFDARTEAKLRRKRAEREKWLDETYMNFVHGGLDVDAGTCLVLYQNPKHTRRIADAHFSILDRLRIRQSQHQQHLVLGNIDDSPHRPAPAVAGLHSRHVGVTEAAD